MSAMQPLYCWFGVNRHSLSKEELILLEAELFIKVCDELEMLFSDKDKDYFQLLKDAVEMENKMLDSKLMRLIINDILSTKEYSLKGIAYYTETFEEVIEEVVIGLNTRPSAIFLRKLIELHKLVRADLYQSIIKKITTQYLSITSEAN